MSNPLLCVLLIATVSALTGCSETGNEQDKLVEPQESSLGFPAINLPQDQIAARIISQASGIGPDTSWFCYEPPTGDVIYPTGVTFNADGTGMYDYNDMTWEFVDDSIIMQTGNLTRTYSDVQMPVPSVIKARIPSRDNDNRVAKATAISDGTGPFTCQAGYDAGRTIEYLPFKLQEFANGPSADTTTSHWKCPARPGPGGPFQIFLWLGADGTGNIVIDDKPPPVELVDGEVVVFNSPSQAITQWSIDKRTLNITAMDGTSLHMPVLAHLGEELGVSVTINGVSDRERSCVLM